MCACTCARARTVRGAFVGVRGIFTGVRLRACVRMHVHAHVCVCCMRACTYMYAHNIYPHCIIMPRFVY